VESVVAAGMPVGKAIAPVLAPVVETVTPAVTLAVEAAGPFVASPSGGAAAGSVPPGPASSTRLGAFPADRRLRVDQPVHLTDTGRTLMSRHTFAGRARRPLQQQDRAVRATDAPLRTVLVVDPQRLVRQALVTAIDTTPGLAAVDAIASGARARDGVDAAVIAARSLGHGTSCRCGTSTDRPHTGFSRSVSGRCWDCWRRDSPTLGSADRSERRLLMWHADRCHVRQVAGVRVGRGCRMGPRRRSHHRGRGPVPQDAPGPQPR